MAWSAVNGFQMALPDMPDAPNGGGPIAYVHTPFSLLPNAISEEEFDRAKKLAPLLNLLVDRIACDRAWLMATLQPVFASDSFTFRLAQLMMVRELPKC